MLPTIASVPEVQSTDVARGASSPDSLLAAAQRGALALLPESVDAVSELVASAEVLALLRIKVTPVTRAGAAGPVVSDTEICDECQRQRVLCGMAHAPSCGVGRVLEACAALRRSGALGVYAGAYADGYKRGQQSAFEQVQGAPSEAEKCAARGRLELVTSPTENPCSHAQTVTEALLRSQQKVVCGRVIAVFGLPGRAALTCDLAIGHGDAWHEDSAAGIQWGLDTTEIVFHPSGMKEVRMLGREPEFTYPSAVIEGAARCDA